MTFVTVGFFLFLEGVGSSLRFAVRIAACDNKRWSFNRVFFCFIPLLSSHISLVLNCFFCLNKDCWDHNDRIVLLAVHRSANGAGVKTRRKKRFGNQRTKADPSPTTKASTESQSKIKTEKIGFFFSFSSTPSAHAWAQNSPVEDRFQPAQPERRKGEMKESIKQICEKSADLHVFVCCPHDGAGCRVEPHSSAQAAKQSSRSLLLKYRPQSAWERKEKNFKTIEGEKTRLTTTMAKLSSKSLKKKKRTKKKKLTHQSRVMLARLVLRLQSGFGHIERRRHGPSNHPFHTANQWKEKKRERKTYRPPLHNSDAWLQTRSHLLRPPEEKRTRNQIFFCFSLLRYLPFWGFRSWWKRL